MQLQFCDRCGKPLSEGCVARGDAQERAGELVCAACLAQAANSAGDDTTGTLAHYEQSIWSCNRCGIPVTALDLIEGRAARAGESVICVRCESLKAEPTKPQAPPLVIKPAMKAPARPAARLPSRGPVAVKARNLPGRTHTAAAEFVRVAEKEQRRPVLPVLLFAVMLPMFALSIYFAISSQQQLAEWAGSRGNETESSRRPVSANIEMLNPGGGPGNGVEPPTEPENPGPAEPLPDPEISDEHNREMMLVEVVLARPVIKKLQSDDLAQVWRGLIEAGSRRLIATRRYVRRRLQDENEFTRQLACHTCALLQDLDAVRRLKLMSREDASDLVRVTARRAVMRLAGKASREMEEMSKEELERLKKQVAEEEKRRKARAE